MRAHVVLPDDLVEEIDRLVGKRRRSAFIAEAARDRVRREGLLLALKETAGILKAEDHPEWADSRKVAAWVRKQRRQNDRRLTKIYGRLPPG